MKIRTITQAEISAATGMPQSYICEALGKVRSVANHLRCRQYEPKAALEAVKAYCRTRQGIIENTAALRIAKWDRYIGELKKMEKERETCEDG